MNAKKIFLNMLMMVLIASVATGCLADDKPNEEKIMSDISYFLTNTGDDTLERTFDNLEEVEKSKNRLLYTFDVIEAREIDDEPAYFSPDYKLKQTYTAQYLKNDDTWGFSAFTNSEDSPIFEQLEEPNMESLLYDAEMGQYSVGEIINSNLDLANGKASYTLRINFDGKNYSKVTEASFDLSINQQDMSWKLDDAPVTKDISIDTSNLLGNWRMKLSNGNSVSIDIIDISDGKATVQFNSTQWADPRTLVDSTSVQWVGEVDENQMNIYRSKDISLVFPVHLYDEYIVFNGEEFYKR